MFERVDVHAVLRVVDREADGAGTDLHQVGASGQHLVLVHPHDVRLELVGYLGRIIAGADDVAPRDVDFVGERDGDGLSCHSFVEVAVHRDDPCNGAGRARRQDPHRVTRSHAATDDLSGESPEVKVRSVDPLDRHAQRGGCPVVVDFDRLEELHQGGTVVPRRVVARHDDVVASQRRQRDEGDVAVVGQPDLLGELEVLGTDRVERVL